MYNRLYSHLTKHNLLHNTTNNLDFRNIVPLIKLYYLHLVDEIYPSFDKNKYTLGLCIYVSKAFDTVDKSYLKNLNIME